MMQGLLAGQVDFIIDTPTTSIPQIQSGNIKGYAIMSKTRLAAIPDVPTVDEAGWPDWNSCSGMAFGPRRARRATSS